jgi:CelD/BcsL family acetyltransferase involved in cellulose biosynthesis
MNWVFVNALTSFEEFQKDWDAINRSRDNHILLDSRFVVPLLRHFGDKNITLAVHNENSTSAMALLVKQGVASWSTFQPSQSPLGLINFSFKDDQHQYLFDLMRAVPGYALIFGVLQQDPLYSSFPGTSNDSKVEILHYIDIPRLQLLGTFEEYWEQRGKNLKHNLERQNRRIKEAGKTVELIAESDPSRVADCVREYGRLESAGWKAQGGTAISEDNAQGRFYRDILEDFCSTGEAVIFQLRLDGKVVATDLCLLRNGMIVILKTTYDETVERLSPALLMRRAILSELYRTRNIKVIEFYGKVRNWHTQWTSETRDMFHVNVFRNSSVAGMRNIYKRLR